MVNHRSPKPELQVRFLPLLPLWPVRCSRAAAGGGAGWPRPRRGWAVLCRMAAVGALGRFNQFVRDVRTEMEQVSWPTRQELIDSTRVIMVVTAFLAVFIGICDWVLSQVMVWLWRVAG